MDRRVLFIPGSYFLVGDGGDSDPDHRDPLLHLHRAAAVHVALTLRKAAWPTKIERRPDMVFP